MHILKQIWMISTHLLKQLYNEINISLRIHIIIPATYIPTEVKRLYKALKRKIFK